MAGLLTVREATVSAQTKLAPTPAAVVQKMVV